MPFTLIICDPTTFDNNKTLFAFDVSPLGLNETEISGLGWGPYLIGHSCNILIMTLGDLKKLTHLKFFKVGLSISWEVDDLFSTDVEALLMEIKLGKTGVEQGLLSINSLGLGSLRLDVGSLKRDPLSGSENTFSGGLLLVQVCPLYGSFTLLDDSAKLLLKVRVETELGKFIEKGINQIETKDGVDIMWFNKEDSYAFEAKLYTTVLAVRRGDVVANWVTTSRHWILSNPKISKTVLCNVTGGLRTVSLEKDTSKVAECQLLMRRGYSLSSKEIEFLAGGEVSLSNQESINVYFELGVSTGGFKVRAQNMENSMGRYGINVLLGNDETEFMEITK